MNDAGSDARLRVYAAKALLPFMHPKLGEGKKDNAQARAERAGRGAFAPSAAPKLKLIDSKA